MHMPPPVHGAAMVGQYIHGSEPINQLGLHSLGEGGTPGKRVYGTWSAIWSRQGGGSC